MKKSKVSIKNAGDGGVFSLNVNGVKLSGVMEKGVWTWTCPFYPTLVAKYDGTADSAGMVEEFMRLVLSDTVMVSHASEGPTCRRCETLTSAKL